MSMPSEAKPAITKSWTLEPEEPLPKVRPFAAASRRAAQDLNLRYSYTGSPLDGDRLCNRGQAGEAGLIVCTPEPGMLKLMIFEDPPPESS